MQDKNNTWSSRFGFIMAATGAAVGLGNIWMFPYIAGKNGGGAFVLLYLLCITTVAIPALMGEILIGKLGKSNQVDTVKKLAKKYKASSNWKYVSVLGAIALFMVLSFYSVVAGWSVGYISYAIQGKFIVEDTANIKLLWEGLLASPLEQLIYHTTFMLLTFIIVNKGVKQGIELASKIMMPLLFLLLFVLLIHGVTLESFTDAFTFMFSFDFSKIDGSVILSATGQAFFTLALGAGCMLVYGSYLPSNVKVGRNVWIIAIINAMVSLLAGLAIFPVVFASGLEPQAGPGLMFQTLPVAFSSMQYGSMLGLAFFALLLFAALTSSISLAEPLVILLSDKCKIKRHKSSFIIGISTWACGVLCLLSFNVLQDISIMGSGIFDIFTGVPTYALLPVGVLGYTLFAGWVIPKNEAKENLNIKSNTSFKLWSTLARYICPLAIVTVITASLL